MRADDFVTGDSARGAGQSSLVGTETTNAVNTGLVGSATAIAKNMVIGGTELGDVDKMYQTGKSAIGYFGGNACDMCRAYCTSTNVRDLKVGMIIADVSHPGTGDAGRLYGHVGIYIGDNKVISNEGAITIKSLQEFVGFYGKGTGCKWGWLGGVDLSK